MRPTTEPLDFSIPIIYEVDGGKGFLLMDFLYKPYKDWQDFVQKKKVRWWCYLEDAVHSHKDWEYKYRREECVCDCEECQKAEKEK